MIEQTLALNNKLKNMFQIKLITFTVRKGSTLFCGNLNHNSVVFGKWYWICNISQESRNEEWCMNVFWKNNSIGMFASGKQSLIKVIPRRTTPLKISHFSKWQNRYCICWLVIKDSTFLKELNGCFGIHWEKPISFFFF